MQLHGIAVFKEWHFRQIKYSKPILHLGVCRPAGWRERKFEMIEISTDSAVQQCYFRAIENENGSLFVHANQN